MIFGHKLIRRREESALGVVLLGAWDIFKKLRVRTCLEPCLGIEVERDYGWGLASVLRLQIIVSGGFPARGIPFRFTLHSSTDADSREVSISFSLIWRGISFHRVSRGLSLLTPRNLHFETQQGIYFTERHIIWVLAWITGYINTPTHPR